MSLRHNANYFTSSPSHLTVQNPNAGKIVSARRKSLAHASSQHFLGQPSFSLNSTQINKDEGANSSIKLSHNGDEFDPDYRAFEDQTINHDDLFRAFSSEGGL